MVRERNAAATTHTTAPINHTRHSPRKHSPDGAARARKQTSDDSFYYSVYRPRKDERLSRPGWLVTYRNKVPPPGVEPWHVTHPSTNRARRRITSLIQPINQSINHYATPPTANHCIHFLLPSIKSSGYSLRAKGHPYQLPRCEYELHKKSFIPRCLYRNCNCWTGSFLIVCFYVGLSLCVFMSLF